MATQANSRYSNVQIIDNQFLGTSEFPDIDLTTIKTLYIIPTIEDRLDSLADKYLGSSRYWWIIAYLNNIEWAFNFIPGQPLIIPQNVQDILKYF